MVEYDLKCPSCEDGITKDVLLPDGLTHTQISDIEKGERDIEMTKEQALSSGITFSSEDWMLIEQQGFWTYDVPRYGVCGPCGSN